jgi:hypothetical protein
MTTQKRKEYEPEKAKENHKPNARGEKTMRAIDPFRGGGYVRNARNQLKEDTRILFNSPRCGEFFDGMVQDDKKV